MAAGQSYVKGFAVYLRLEKRLSEASVEAYLHDVAQFETFVTAGGSRGVPWRSVRQVDVEDFLKYLYDMQLQPATQARMLSGLKSFFAYLVEEGNWRPRRPNSWRRPNGGGGCPTC